MTSETTAADDGYLELRALKAGKKPHQNVEKPVPSGLRGGAGRARTFSPEASKLRNGRRHAALREARPSTENDYYL